MCVYMVCVHMFKHFLMKLSYLGWYAPCKSLILTKTPSTFSQTLKTIYCVAIVFGCLPEDFCWRCHTLQTTWRISIGFELKRSFLRTSFLRTESALKPFREGNNHRPYLAIIPRSCKNEQSGTVFRKQWWHLYLSSSE